MRQLVLEKENSKFKPVKLRLKIDLVSYPARAEGLVNMVDKNVNVSKELLYLSFLKGTNEEKLYVQYLIGWNLFQ